MPMLQIDDFSFYDFVIDFQVKEKDSRIGRENVMNFLILESFTGWREKYLNEIYSIWCLPAFQLNIKRLFKTFGHQLRDHRMNIFSFHFFKIPLKFFCFNIISSLHFESITIKKSLIELKILYFSSNSVSLKIENISR